MHTRIASKFLPSLAAAVLAPLSHAAVILDFEEVAQTNVSPTSPVETMGYVLVTENADAAVFPSEDFNGPDSHLVEGNPTVVIAFAGENTVSVTTAQAFSLYSLDIAVTSISALSSADFVILGDDGSPGGLSATFTNVTANQTVTLNWINLNSVQITSSTDGAIDNLVVSPVPEPSVAALTGLLGLGFVLRRRRD